MTICPKCHHSINFLVDRCDQEQPCPVGLCPVEIVRDRAEIVTADEAANLEAVD